MPRPIEGISRGIRDRWRIGVGASIVLVLVAIAVAVVIGFSTSPGTAAVVSLETPPSGMPPTEAGEPRVEGILVHVHGAVRQPGLYELSAGARVVDAVAAADGLADDADTGGINLARKVSDGEQLGVPRLGGPDEPPPGVASGRISLGSATIADLDTLPGIGPVMAGKIVAWREQGNSFASVDDLLEIEGFGEKTVDALRDLVVP